MPLPDFGVNAQAVYDDLAPVAEQDEALGFPLAHFVNSMGSATAELSRLVSDDEEAPGWSILLDADRAPSYALPWLAQLVGVTLPVLLPGETEADYEARQRDAIKDPAHFKRGTVAYLAKIAQLRLTGNKTVFFRERDTSAYHLTISTRTAETPDAAGTNADLQAVKPAGLVLVHSTITGQDWQNVVNTRANWTAVIAAYATWDALGAG